MQVLWPTLYKCTASKLHVTVSGRALDNDHLCMEGSLSLAVQRHMRDTRNIWDTLVWNCPSCNTTLTGE